MSDETGPRPFPIMEPTECTECGKVMPVKTLACVPGWGQIVHWWAFDGCDASDDEDDDWDDFDDWDDEE